MAETPTPRSYTQILGSMIATFASKARIKALKVGGPILSILEAAAQSDTRSTQETFNILAASSLENAEGTALERHAKDEDLKKRGATFTTGVVSISDSRYTKKETSLYPGSPAPIVGSSVVYLSSVDGFPLGGGQVYIGRGTSNYEGPLTYTSITGASAPFTMNLSAGSYTKKFHNTSESVVLAQGGNRLIPSGTQVQTPQGNSSDAVTFSTTYPATILDGEVSIENIAVVCNKPGAIGRVISGAINSFAGAPFTGATVTNPTPFTNGTDVESERDLKDRIRRVRQSRSKGTDLALQESVTGIIAADENKQVQSASIVSRLGSPTTVYIDDGTGYEEAGTGIALESLTDYAGGGETDFSLASPRPVSKAFIKSTLSAPYNIAPGSELTVYVGGIVSRHSFSEDQFPNIANASGYDVAAAINANASLLFGARTADNGKNVILFAKSDVAENIKVSTSTVDANLVFGFPLSRIDTLRLYLNDVLLNKDGVSAVFYSNARSTWRPMTTGVTLTVAVDGTAAQTYTFTDADFINAKTGYTVLSHRNSLEAWVAVFNQKIPGITAATDQTGLFLTSNAGASSRASIEITGGTLVVAGMFSVGKVVGTNRDYTLNRNTGQIRLTKSLTAGDKLTAGTVASRAFIESGAIKNPINIATAGTMYVFVDSAAQIVPCNITGSTAITVALASPVTTITCTGTTPFANVQSGDWIILTDTALSAGNKGAWRVARVDPAWTYVVIYATTNSAQTSVSLAQAGITVVRSDAMVQEIPIGVSANWTAVSLAAQMNTVLVGAKASVSRTNRFRITTNTLDSTGDVMVAAISPSLSSIPVSVGTLATSNVAQVGTVVSGNSDFGTPTFSAVQVTAAVSRVATTSTTLKYDYGSNIVGLKRFPLSTALASDSTNRRFVSQIESVSGSALTLRKTPLRGEWIVNDRIYAASPFAISATDTLNVVVDGDQTAKAFSPQMWRKCSTVGAYASTITLKDADNGGQSLAVAFGTSANPFNFQDFAVMTRARALTHYGTASRLVLWRNNRFGNDGMNATIRYEYPLKASQSLLLVVDPYTTNKLDYMCMLPSGAAGTLSNLRATTKLGSFQLAKVGNGAYNYYLIAGLQISRFSRIANGDVTVTVLYPDAAMNLTPNPLGLSVGDWVYVSPSTTGTSFDGTAGYRQITAVSAGAAPYTFTYNDALSTVEATGDGTTSNIGTVSADNALASWTGIAVNDIISIDSAVALGAALKGTPLKVSAVDANFRWIKVVGQQGGSTSTVISWGQLYNTANLTNFQIVSNTAAQIVAAVNALSGAPLTAAVAGTGTGAITQATWDELNDINIANRPYFADGVCYVRSYTAPASTSGDYTFTLKAAANSYLAAGCDWANEEVRLVPMTAANITAWLNSPAVGGLFANSEIRAAVKNSKVQLATNTAGSQGSIAVLGGTANSAMAGVVGSPGVTVDGLASYVYVRAPEIAGFHAGNYVAIENTLPHTKPLTATLNSITVANGIATFTFASNIRTAGNTASTWQIEKHGDYMYFVWDTQGSNPATSGYTAGDYIGFSGAGLATGNTGTFQIVAYDGTLDGFWVKNPNCVEQQLVSASIVPVTSTSVMPGDILVIGGDEWGETNRGAYTILTASGTTFTVAAPNMVPVTGPIVATGFNQIISGTNSTLVKKIRSIVQHPTDSSLVMVVFDDVYNYNLISSNFGSVLKAQDKLAFPTSIYAGTDGYARSTGLVAEAIKVLYGDPRDTDTYPGYVSSGSNIGVSGPIVRRLNISVAVRIRGGASVASIFNAVKSAVASVVNSSKIGQPIPFSDIVNAVSGVNGVLAVTILNPTYGSGNDMITVQPYEKAMILNVDSDVQVTIAGS